MLFNAERVGLIPGQGAKIPLTSGPEKTKTLNRSNIVADSMKTLKMVQIKIILKKKKKKKQIKAELPSLIVLDVLGIHGSAV